MTEWAFYFEGGGSFKINFDQDEINEQLTKALLEAKQMIVLHEDKGATFIPLCNVRLVRKKAIEAATIVEEAKVE